MLNPISLFYTEEFINSCISSLTLDPFWSEDGNGKVQKIEDHQRLVYLSKTLPSFGFFNLPIGNELVAVQVNGNLIRRVTEKDITSFVSTILSKFVKGNAVLDRMTTQYAFFFDAKVLTSLRVVDKPIIKDNRITAYRFFLNGAIVVSAKSDSVTLTPYAELNGLVWSSKVLDREITLSNNGSFVEENILNELTPDSGQHFHRWCQNLCKSQDHDQAWIYDQNRFKSLVSGLGYLLHRYWNDHKCVILIDEDLNSGSANGRTGKSCILNYAMLASLSGVEIPAKGITKNSNNQFIYNFVNESTEYVVFDDATEEFDFALLFPTITGSFVANKKYGSMTQFSNKEKPKMALSTNHRIKGSGFSYEDRQHIVAVGSYYRHHKEVLGITPDTIHGGWLLEDDWGTTNWLEFDRFMVFCLHYYLKHGLINKGSGEKYRLNKLVVSVGSPSLVSIIHRFLQLNVGKETYSYWVEEMSSDLKDRCLRDYASSHIPEETHSTNQLSNGLNLVAEHFGFKINVGLKDRPQKRFGPSGSNRRCVNSYFITDSKSPFPKKEKSVSVEVITEPASSNDLSPEEVQQLFGDLK